MFRSLRLLSKDFGLRPDKSAKVSSREQLTPDNYKELLESTGYKVEHMKAKSYQVPIDGFHYISEFRDWIGVLQESLLKKVNLLFKKLLKKFF